MCMHFVCLEERLVVEVDGGQHNDALQAANDSERSDMVRATAFAC